MDLTLAVTEAVTNAVLHAFIDRAPGTIRVPRRPAPDELTVVVTDDGRGMQPRADSPGLGLGLPTIGRLAALVDLREPPGGGTELSMTFATPGVRGPARDARGRASRAARRGRADRAGRVAGGGRRAAGRPAGPGGRRRLRGRRDRPHRLPGALRRAASTGSDEDSAWLAALRPRADAPRSATRAALEDGRPHVSELTLDLIERITTNADDAARMAATGIRWWIVVPLREGERLLGLLHFGMLPGARAAARRAGRVPDRDRRARRRRLAHTQLIAELRRMRHRFERILDVLGEAVTVRDATAASSTPTTPPACSATTSPGCRARRRRSTRGRASP